MYHWKGHHAWYYKCRCSRYLKPAVFERGVAELLVAAGTATLLAVDTVVGSVDFRTGWL